MAGEIKHTVDKVMDTIGGTAGKLGASAMTSADGFVESAAIGNLYELEAARLAVQRSETEPVTNFARKMLLDHTTAMHQMQAALEMNETSGVALPPKSLDLRRQTMLKHLEDTPQDDFNKTYMDQQVLAHEETVSLMRGYADGGDNPQLRSLALGMLPVVERHLQQAKAIKSNNLA